MLIRNKIYFLISVLLILSLVFSTTVFADIDDAVSKLEQHINNFPDITKLTISNQNGLLSIEKEYNSLTQNQINQLSYKAVRKLRGLKVKMDALNTVYTLGNVNEDENKSIDSTDALLALQGSVKKVNLSKNQILAADVNQNGELTSSDALSILQYSVKKIKNFVSLNVFEAFGPINTVYSYASDVQNYVLSGGKGEYLKNTNHLSNQAIGTVFEFYNNNCDIDKITLEYSTDISFVDDVVSIELSPETDKHTVYNLYKDSTYYWRVIVLRKNGVEIIRSDSFKTASEGPRAIYIEKVYNTRDIGGYINSDGKRTKQGMIYRGGALTPDGSPYPHDIQEAGKYTMSTTLGIKTELDLRGSETFKDPPTTSPIPGANLVYAWTDGYSALFQHNTVVKEIFELLTDESNYPIYMHCTGGADRTGTIAFLIEALLGVSEKDIKIDFEFTTFSCYGDRQYNQIKGLVNGYRGSSLQERTEKYLDSIGITEEQIAKIKSILIED